MYWPIVHRVLCKSFQLHKGAKLNINCTDRYGNTALHIAAYCSQQEVAVLLLQNGIDATAKNAKGLYSCVALDFVA